MIRITFGVPNNMVKQFDREDVGRFPELASLCEAINAVQPFELKFDIVGTVQKPEFKGFKESLMAITKPYLMNLKDTVINDGVNAIKNLLQKKFGK